MKKDRLSVMVGIFVMLTLVLASCQPQTVEVVKEVPVEVEVEVTRVVEVEAPETHTYTVSWVSTDVTSFDPHSCYSTDCLTFMRVVYEALVGYKHGTTDLEGNLAESWNVSDDGLQYTFTLRDGMTFADGSPITAADVVYSTDRLSGMAKGPSNYLGGVYESAEAVDDKTVVITTNSPMGPLLSMLPRVFVVNSAVVQEHATDDDPWAEDWMYENDAGSGPFVLENWEHGVKLSVVKNLNYWDPARPANIDRYMVLYIAERATAQLLLEKGDIDGIGFPVVDMLPSFEANPDITVGYHESFKGMNMIMSNILPPLDDVKVREALSYAFDYQAFVDGIFQGQAVQAQGPVPYSMKFHDDSVPIIEHDLDKASAMLAEAGHAPGTLELEILVIPGYTPWVGTAQIFQQNLAEIDVDLKILELPWSEIAARGANPDNPVMMMPINSFPGYPDPDTVLYSPFHTSQHGDKGGYNYSYYGSDETDKMIEDARYSTDEAEREEIYKKIQHRLASDFVYMWLVNETALSVQRSWVKGFNYDPTWHETYRPDLYVIEGKP